MKELWQNYLFLTREMKKFLCRKELDLFFEIMKQRENVQARIDTAPDDGYRLTPEGQKLLESIRENNQDIILAMQQQMYQLKQQHNVSQAYEGGAAKSGRRLDFEG
ncbi:MAG TPA: hypothetical protein VN370_14760 [Desulfitobacteriaceae bacterium]|nr:hypothetical protein [Desulfitobacteriaceae bacterium]